MIKLYSYFRSSASLRVRIALNLKKISHEIHTIDLSKNENASQEYLKINPQGLVPVLIDNRTKISQSIAILEYLEEAYPEYPLLPKSLNLKSKIRSIMQIIACEIQPTGNLSMINYLKNHYHLEQSMVDQWCQDWIYKGFEAIEVLLTEVNIFCFGLEPTLADVCLYPQVCNARRFKCDLSKFPRIQKIAINCDARKEFFKSSPIFSG